MEIWRGLQYLCYNTDTQDFHSCSVLVSLCYVLRWECHVLKVGIRQIIASGHFWIILLVLKLIQQLFLENRFWLISLLVLLSLCFSFSIWNMGKLLHHVSLIIFVPPKLKLAATQVERCLWNMPLSVRGKKWK